MDFSVFVGIDYSGAWHCGAGLSGLRVFRSDESLLTSTEVRPSGSSRAHWSREGVAHWLVECLSDSTQGPVLVGLDHALSFPAEYFALHGIPLNWERFLEHFCVGWPLTRRDQTVKGLYTAYVRAFGAPHGQARWRRIAEKRSKGAKSVFHFGVPGSVASSTHAGLPWIQFLRNHPRLMGRVHFWPFDGWIPKPGHSVVAEVYPSLWNKRWEKRHHTQDQHDACVIVNAFIEAQKSRELSRWFNPETWRGVHLSEHERFLAGVEGWILGLN